MSARVYFINLAGRPDRRAFMEDQLEALGLSVSRIEAVTPANIAPEERARYCNREQARFLRENELACTLSHERAWAAARSDAVDWAVVLEDDVVLSKRLPHFIARLGEVEEDLVRLETALAPTRVFPASADMGRGLALRRFRSTPFGSAAYAITAQGMALASGDPGLRRRPFDIALFSPFETPGARLSRVLIEPALACQLGNLDAQAAGVAASDVHADGVVHAFAHRHPVRFGALNAAQGLHAGMRNVLDHLRHRGQGLERRIIAFASD